MFVDPRWKALPLAACALLSAAASAADPSDPAAPAPTLVYRSPFDGYRRYVDQPVGSWREANDLVGRIGGWRAYAKEAQQPDTPGPGAPAAQPPRKGAEPAGAQAPAPKPAGGHAGYHGGKQ